MSEQDPTSESRPEPPEDSATQLNPELETQPAIETEEEATPAPEPVAQAKYESDAAIPPQTPPP